MKGSIRVRELADWEIEDLEKGKNFKHIQPVACANCGCKGTFSKRLFQIEGFKDEESGQGILSLHMKRKHGIERYIFRTDGHRKFIEAGFCQKCSSTNVIFDLMM